MKTIVQLFFGRGSIENAAGTERAFALMSNAAASRGYRVIDIYNDVPGKTLFFPLDPKVEFHNLGLGKINAPLYLKVLREIAKTCHLPGRACVSAHNARVLATHIETILQGEKDIAAIICYEHNADFAANLLIAKCPKIGMLHNPPDELLKPLSRWERAQANKMDAYQVLMPSFIKDAKDYLTTRVACIPNISEQVSLTSSDLTKRSAKDKHTIVHIGRIEPNQKRQLILARAFAKSAHAFPNWDLHFYGSEENKVYKASIDAFIQEVGLEDRILFKGLTQDPLKTLMEADIFALPSAFEGFGLVLTEAMTCGLGVLGFRNATAVNELIHNNENGLLADNEDDFAEKLAALMDDAKLRQHLGVQANIDARVFSANHIWTQWEALISECTQH
jgi:glycosyltransferase involved in cell wall biosynthesis